MDGYTSHNKRSKSVSALPSSLIHDIDGNSNKTVVLSDANNGDDDNTIVHMNENEHENENGNGNHNENHSESNDENKYQIKNIKDKSDNNDNVLLSANGRIVSTNNKHSFNNSNNTANKINEDIVVNPDSKNISVSVKGKRVRAEEEEKGGKINDTKKSKLTDIEKEEENKEEIKEEIKEEVDEIKVTKSAEEIEQEIIENIEKTEKAELKDKERKKKYLSKTNKWAEFTFWVEKLRVKEISESNNNEISGSRGDNSSSSGNGSSSVSISSSGSNMNTDINSNTNTDTSTNSHGNIVTSSSTYKQSHRKYDVIVDGANVGYYKQNFSGAPSHIDYRQVDWMIRQLICRGTLRYVTVQCSVV